MDTSAPAGKANGLTTVINTVASPGEAFETIRVAPTWGWAVIIAAVLMIIGAFLQGPAMRHAQMVQMQKFATSSSLAANMTPEQKRKMIEGARHPSALGQITSVVGPVIGLFIAVLLNTLFMLIGNAVGRGQADFKRLWAGSMNIAVPTAGISAIVLGVIVMLRSPDSFNSTLDVLKAIPSLAWLMPNASPGLVAFGAAVSIFTLWGLFLNATMLRVTAKTSAGVAYTFAALVTLLGGLFASGLVQVFHNFGMG